MLFTQNSSLDKHAAHLQSQPSHQTFRSGSLAALAAAVMLVACGGGGGGGGDSKASAPAAPTQATPQPQVNAYELQNSVPALTYPAGAWQRAAHAYLNEHRDRCGFGKLRQSDALDKAAQGHSEYLVQMVADNVAAGLAQPVTALVDLGLSLHEQSPERALYTGQTVGQRVRSAGYTGAVATEQINHPSWSQPSTTTDAEKEALKAAAAVRALRGLLTGTYHLEYLISDTRDVGFGMGTINPWKVDANAVYGPLVVNGGWEQRKQASLTQTLSFPCDGTSEIDAALWAEVPDPTFGQGLSMPIGPAIMVVSPAGTTLKIQTVSITPVAVGSDGRSNNNPLSGLPIYTYGAAYPSGVLILNKDNDANKVLSQSEKAFIHAHKPLEYATTYRADIAFTVDGAPKTKTFQFTTKKQYQ